MMPAPSDRTTALAGAATIAQGVALLLLDAPSPVLLLAIGILSFVGAGCCVVGAARAAPRRRAAAARPGAEQKT